MTDKELRKLRRPDLLEMLIAAEKKKEELEKDNRELKAQKEAREILIANTGSIAEAALQLNGIFGAAQDAASQYLENIRRVSGEQDAIAQEIQSAARTQADAILAKAQAQADAILSQAREKAGGIVSQAQDSGILPKAGTDAGEIPVSASRK